jgi:hypothetical protein
LLIGAKKLKGLGLIMGLSARTWIVFSNLRPIYEFGYAQFAKIEVGRGFLV